MNYSETATLATILKNIKLDLVLIFVTVHKRVN